MSNNIYTVEHLFTLLKDKLNLIWHSGHSAKSRAIETHSAWGDHPKIIGHMNLIHPNRIQVVGEVEMAYITSLTSEHRANVIKTLFSSDVYCIVVSDGQEPPQDLVDASNHCNVPLIISSESSFEVVSLARYQLAQLFSQQQTLHGVFMEVISVGVLLKGKSSVGKSELALELISRGHRLIADDAPEFSRLSPEIISGRCPELLKDFLEVRGIGVLNIREMYGDGAIKLSKYLRLIIELVPQEEFNPNIDRLNYSNSYEAVLGVNIPVITLQMAPGRNLAVMVEAAVRTYKLKNQGYDANIDFIERHKALIQRNESS